MRFFCYNLTLDIEGTSFFDSNRTKPLVIDCLNPHSFITAEDDPLFKEALKACDILLPDGVGICMQVHKWRDTQIKKIAGNDLHLQLLNELNAINGRVCYLGSRPEVLQKIEQRLSKEYPNISVMTHSPSFSEKISEEESAAIVDKINTFGADALFVGMTAPKQEKWIYAYCERLTTVKVAAAIGGAFDFFAGTIKRAPEWAINMHIEWLVRFIREPRRMWKRNMVSTPRFLSYVYKNHAEM